MDKDISFSFNTILKAYSKSRILIDSISKDEAQSNIAFSWLLILRWGALLCQTLLVLLVYIFFKTSAPLPILILIIAFEGGSNIAFHSFFQKRNKPIPGLLFAAVMFLDILLLTALLHWTGGPMNPFTFLFLIHISLGAIIMRPLWAWTLAVFTTLSYAGLFFLPHTMAEPGFLANPPGPISICGSGGLPAQPLNLHLQGMWVAFTVTVFFIVFFVNKIQQDLEDHHKTLVELETEKNRSEKLASLATLAAGAAHEFSTPLSTIAVAAGEMLSTLKTHQADKELIADTRLIREQVERCREILYQMSADAGEHLAEALRVFTLDELCSDVLAGFPEEVRKNIQVSCAIKNFTIRMPFRTLKRIIRGLIKNAIDATIDESPVAVSCRKDDRFLYIEVRDQGQGMDQETLTRAIEPFFTTKEPGKGLGLGLFLAESAAERLGGFLNISSIPGKGTTAIISFSLSQIQCG